MYEYLNEIEDYALDVIGVCCDFTESTIQEALDYYNLDTLEELEDNTTVLNVSCDTIIYANY